jgi:hypothetical protein
MNKNMQELALKAGFLTAGFKEQELVLANEDTITKFGHLLLKECVMLARLNNHNETVYQIRQHFEF